MKSSAGMIQDMKQPVCRASLSGKKVGFCLGLFSPKSGRGTGRYLLDIDVELLKPFDDLLELDGLWALN